MPAAQQHNSRSAQARLETSAVYKRLVIMLRSLFSYVRALPAYRLYRAWKVCTLAWRQTLTVTCVAS